MALSALSWQVGFALGPAVGGFVLAYAPNAVWLGAAAFARSAGRSRSWSRRRSLREPAGRPHQLPPPPPEPVMGRFATGPAARITNMALTLDDPLSTDAEPAPHPAIARSPRLGPGRRAPGAGRPRAQR